MFTPKKKLEDMIHTRVLLTLSKSAKEFHTNLYLSDRREDDGLTLMGILSEVNKHGIFFHNFPEGTVAWMKALQAVEEGKMTEDEYWENHMEPIFFPWHSIVAIS